MTYTQEEDCLKEALKMGSIHVERMNSAYDRIEKYFPLTKEKYIDMPQVDHCFFDQLIFRFTRLCDLMAESLFHALLEIKGENTRDLPLDYQVSKLEELNLLETPGDWLVLTETRNIVSQYPFDTKEVIDGLNLLSKHSLLILIIWKKINEYISNRFSTVE